ncbi:MAG TPA: lactate racemase domain-containing protein [Gemmataceae bacterium]|nr:lactate racemase domain-containing protein [Gemmataceae bacterium]
MRVAIEYGRQRAELEVTEDALVPSRVASPPRALADPVAAISDALEHPFHFPPLRRALTPDDQVAVLIDERLPQLASLLVPVLEYVVAAGVDPGAITLLCPPSSSGQPWLEDLPEALEEVHCEVHAPQDRRRLSFVTRMRGGRELLFNRTAVDASQLIVLSARRYDPLLGHGGGEGALFPVFSDESTRKEASQQLSLDVPGTSPWPAQREATDAVWLLGAPFFLQVIEGTGDSVADVVGGIANSLDEGRRLQDAHWRRTVAREADTVVASLSGDPARHGFAELADAVTCASRVLRPNGRIVLLTESSPSPGPVMTLLREADDPAAALTEIRRRSDYELRAAWQWATVAQEHRIFLLSGLPDDMVEDLFAVPLENVSQAQRLVSASASCLVLGDAHKALALVES